MSKESKRFEKLKKGKKQRPVDSKIPRANSYLIVTEGECTEPNYLIGIKKEIEKTVGGNVDVEPALDLDIEGIGESTSKLIRFAEKKIKNAKIIYQNVWIVFDRDDFYDFDKAIKEGKDKGYSIAWSNACFEYWLYLHFYYSDSALSTSEWEEKVNEQFRKNNICGGTYNKNDPNVFSELYNHKYIDIAIKNAINRMKSFNAGMLPSKFDPGTTVHILVKELLNYITEE